MQHLSRDSTDPPAREQHIGAYEAEDVENAKSGDEAAFSRLFEQYNAPICAYLGCLVGNAEVGRDLAQETFLRAWRGLSGLTDTKSFKSWLFRIATNLAHSHMRRERLMSWLPWHEQRAHEEDAWIEGPEMQAETIERVHQTLAQLGTQARICLLLQLYAGFSQREIATVLAISEKSVSAYVSRGREQFRKLYYQSRGGASR